MSRLKWDDTGKRIYEMGVDRGVLFTMEDNGYGEGSAWDGLINVTESPDGAEAKKLYANNKVYANLMSKENLKIKIEAYAYPRKFGQCNGEVEVATGVSIGQQTRKPFALCYRTKIGNDTEGNDLGYKIHIVYGLLASPSEKAYGTMNEDPDAITFSWDANATPVDVSDHDVTASIVIDSTTTDKEKLKTLEDTLYGNESTASKILMPDDVIALIGKA